ncbi:MFS transporter [Clostridium bovifaecis]|uniref:MFS transporter n=1 Tax=Clostridium bovifaecis TaxID=2184719 RepID=A0A6I6EU62_9CLOT|nr:MFS transporter [Clostridium bovifaecis]
MDLVTSSKRLIDNNFHALTSKNFRYYWIGQCFSLIGTWMQSIGQSWLVLTLTDSSLRLGILAAVQFLPITLFSLFAGIIIDKFPKKNILLFTQTISMILALLLSILVFTHKVRYSYILIFALILGFTNTIDMPTRQSFVIELVGKEDLMNAVALNSVVFNLARIIGPAIGAVMLALFGAAWCFLLNGLSFIAVIYGIKKIKVNSYIRKKDSSSKALKEVKDGIVYIIKNPILFETVLLVTIMGIFAFNYNVLLPVFTKNVLYQAEKTYGILMSALGAGSLVGALIVSSRSKKGPKTFIMVISTVLVSIFLILTGLTRHYYLTALSLIVTGLFNISFSTTANSTLQINSKDEYRGRVMSVYSMVFAGTAPLGSLLTGAVSEKLGANTAFIISGTISLASVLVIAAIFRKSVLNEKTSTH